MQTISIKLNGENFEVSHNETLQQLIARMGLVNKRYAIEVNEQIIPRSQHESHVLQSNDQIEIVQAIGGG